MSAAEITDGFRLSPQQLRLWRLAGEARTGVFWCRRALLLEGPLEPGAVREALERIATRHEILRTRFAELEGVRIPVQVVGAPDLAWTESEETEVGADEPAVLRRGPVLRAEWHRLAEDRHRLTVSLPALCCDGPSLELLTRELGQELAGTHPGPPEDDLLQYADVAEWQHELFEDEDAAPGRAHWNRRAVAELWRPPASWLPCRKDTAPFDPAVLPVGPARPAPDRAEAAEELASARGCPVELVLLAAWHGMLQSFPEAPRTAVARPFPGRSYEGLESCLGPLARYLPVETATGPDQGLRDALREIEASAEDAARWQELFDWESLAPPAGGTPRFPFGFDYQDLRSPSEAGDARLSVLTSRARTERFLARLGCTRGTEGLALELEYDRGLLATEQAEHLAERFGVFLEAALEHPERPFGDLPRTGPAERSWLVGGREAGKPSGREAGFVEAFLDQARRHPGRPAVVSGDGSLTYRALERRSARLAHALARRGAGPELPIALLVERSVQSLVGLLGILRSGAAYLALDPTAPESRIDLQVERAGVRLLVAEEGLMDRMAGAGPEVVELTSASEEPGEPVDWADRTIHPRSLAYVLFTSGSSGEPKGVGVSHGNLSSYVAAVSRALGWSGDDPLHFASTTTLAADLGNTAIFPALATGGCLHLLSYEVATDAAAFRGYLQEHRVDVLKITPSHLQALLKAGPSGAGLLPKRHLVLGGEALPHALAQALRESGSPCRVINHYGPTEATIGATIRVGPGDGDAFSATVPIGRPLPHAAAFVLGAHEPTPAGIPGELCIGGGGIARGYVGRPRETAERFVPDRFTGEPGRRLYRTGDRVRYVPSGELEFLGRIDEQVKIRGFRVEPAEVEHALAGHPGVREVAVAPFGEPPQLAAWIVREGDVLPEGEAARLLRDHLSRRLPEYMLPVAVDVLAQLPRTSNGKLDRRALPKPKAGGGAEYVAPANEVEREVAEIWSDALGVDRVGREDNFFTLGGDSIRSIRLRYLAEQKGWRFDAQDLYRYPVLAAFARHLAERAEEGAPGETDDLGVEQLSDGDVDALLAELSDREESAP